MVTLGAKETSVVEKTTRVLGLAAAILCLLASATLGVQSGLTVNGQCVGDANGDAQVSIDELVMAVQNALSGCPQLPVNLQFRGMVGDRAFACGQLYHGVGTSNSDIVPTDFRFYLHDIRLVNMAGEDVPLMLDQDPQDVSEKPAWQLDDLALLDFEDQSGPCGAGTAATNSVVHGTVPPGEYRGVRFKLGVPFEMDHQNQATADCPLCWSGLFWSWQAGYKFLRFDTNFLRADKTLGSLSVHVGSTGCEYGTPPVIDHCARPNVAEVFLDGFDPLHDVIIADMAAVLANSDLDTSQGCQSDPDNTDCGPIFKNLGIDFNTGLPTPATQTFFRVQ